MSVILADRYRLGDKVASGGMGTVFEAIDEKLDRSVAVKFLKEELSSDARFVERFRREARAAAALAHPNIASVYDYGVDSNRHFIVMELVDGRDLSRLLAEERPLDPERSAHIGSQIAAALDHAHKAGVIHRDIKPGNVIVSAGDRVKVTDFGIARAAGDSTLTATGTMLGTAHYISPEQAAGKPAGTASDIYATGVVVFEMLTGSRPFEGESPVAIAMQHATGELPSPSSIEPRVPTSFDEVIARATAKDPADRYRDAGDLGVALVAASVRADADGATSDETLEYSVWPIPGDRWDPERIGRIVVVGFVALVLIAGALLGYRLTHRDKSRKLHAQASASSQRRAHGRSSPSPTAQLVTVPEDVIGMSYGDAWALLLRSGLRPKPEHVSSDDIDFGHVVSTDPPPGTVVPAGHTVTVLVSSGDERGHGAPHVPPGHDKHDKEKEHDR
ncbi:MAG: protein kinase [Actinomycetota bacterium]|nr:protein kinase [Actinomycetota bacterium]